MVLDVTRRVARGALLSRELGRALDTSELEARERSLVTDLVYGVARWRIWLDAALAPHLARPQGLPEAVQAILRLGAYDRLKRETPAHAAVHAWVNVTKREAPRFAGLVNAVLRRVTPPTRDLDPATEHALPRWLWDAFETALGDDAPAAVAAMRQPAPLWFATFRLDAEEALAAQGADVKAGPVTGTIRVRSERRPGDLAGFETGALQPLNPTSALVTQALPAQPGDRVLDLCSGRGVKTALLAARGFHVTGIEREAKKAEQARRNLSRLHLDAEHVTRDLTRTPDDVPPAPYVLIDAPCSGTGTLRGHPEIVERLTASDVTELARTQRDLLDTAYHLTEPGGTLVYSVCSLTRKEGPDVIAHFLETHPDATLSPVPWSELAPHVPTRDASVGTYLLPRDGLDGFFVARMTRNAR